MSQASQSFVIEIPRVPLDVVEAFDERAPPHTWSDNDRTILCLLKTLYDITSSDTVSIFNHIFKERLAAEGLGHGISSAAISSQWWKVQHHQPDLPFFNTLETHGLKGVRSFCDEREHIEAAAADLDIQLIINTSLPISPSNKDTSRSGTRRKPKRTILDAEDASSDAGSPETPSKKARPTCRQQPKPTIFNARAKANTQLAATQTESEPSSQTIVVSKYFGSTKSISLIIRFDAEGNKTYRKPRLLFRAFQPEHGFRARRFLRDDQIPTPPAFESQDFVAAVVPHLNHLGGNDYPSPVLSLAQNPANAMNILQERSAEQLLLAVFDYLDIEAETKVRFGEGAGPYLVPLFLQTTQYRLLAKQA